MESAFSKTLREQSVEMRVHVKAMLGRLDGRGSFAADLQAIAAMPDVPQDVASRVTAIATSLEGGDSTPLITAIAGAVTANVYDALADLTDYLTAKGSLKTVVDKIRGHRQFNAALRAAASSNNWELFDELSKNWSDEAAATVASPTNAAGGTNGSASPAGGSGSPAADDGGGVG